MVVVSVYANSSCTVKIDEYMCDATFESEEHDLNDGEDWWSEILATAEDDFSDSWCKVVIVSKDERNGRVFKRSDYMYCETEANPSFISRIFLFSDSPMPCMNSHFANQIYFEYSIEKFDCNKFYLEARDEQIIKELLNMFSLVNETYKYVAVVLNPSEHSIVTTTLMSHFKKMIYFKDYEHFSGLAVHARLLNNIIEMKESAHTIHANLDFYSLDGVNTSKLLYMVMQTNFDDSFERFKNHFKFKLTEFAQANLVST